MKLPSGFLSKMNRLLGEDEYAGFLESYDKPRYYGLRVNTLKISVEEFLKISPFKLEPVPWTEDGFYYQEGENPGKHPFYHAGLYYIQEPSAMLPGAILGARPGEKVLDLCAAPGGKTVQIAASMKNSGVLIANDINSDRVKALVKNIELCGVKNAVVLNESPEKIAAGFEGYFDRILIDAPCSGEGMFRKDEDAARSWESFKCETCSGMQKSILDSVDAMLKPGGTLVYSTCTFSPEEDEGIITYFLNKHPGYEPVEIEKKAGMEPGRPEWSDGNPGLSKTARLWPHRVKGEGHFAALLRKGGGRQEVLPAEARKNQDTPMPDALRAFAEENLNFEFGQRYNQFSTDVVQMPREIGVRKHSLREHGTDSFRHMRYTKLEGKLFIKGRNIYMLPEDIPSLDGIKVAKFGWYIGEIDNGRFEPSHSFITALSMKDVKRKIDFGSGSYEVKSYLKGETLMVEGDKGYTAVGVEGYTLGWAKQTGGMLKNMYPKGWRRMS